MDFGLKDKIALVTGAARGIGFAEARVLAAEGAHVAIVDLDPAAGKAAAAALLAMGAQAEAYVGDAANEADVARITEAIRQRFGRLDILVNNAGIGVKPAYTTENMPVEAWDRMVHVHMRSSFLWSRAAIPLMTRNGFGRIVNTSSMNFTGGGRPGVSHYAAAKAGIAGFTRTLAKEVGPQGITANAIAPGYVETELIAGFTPEMRQIPQVI
jgi:3-oxoacyl-[acyl-carrier protein] reductase